MKVAVVGGGWAGCSAAYQAKKSGAEVVLVERTDMLLGTGLVGGIMRNNGRYTAAEEAIALGLGDLFHLTDALSRHRNLYFPGHSHASLYDVRRIEPAVKKLLKEKEIDIKLNSLVNSVTTESGSIKNIETSKKELIEADAFIDTTGSAGPMKNCIKYGTGCAMCVLRCPTFGPRTSVTGLAGVDEVKAGDQTHGFEAISGSCKLDKKSLAKWLVRQLEASGVVIIPLPPKYYKAEILRKKACQQYALPEYATNLIILDTGHAKLMTPFFPIESLRELNGFREARFADPYSGGIGNSVRFMAIAPCDETLKIHQIDNLYCAGEKTGPLVGHTEAIITGAVAGHNAVRSMRGRKARVLPPELAVGDIIKYMLKELNSSDGLLKKYTFSGSVYFQRMKEKGLYTIDKREIAGRVKRLGYTGLFE